MLFKEALSKRIIELCNQFNYSPNKLAEMSGIAPSTLRDTISGLVDNPSATIIFKICKTLNIEMKDFFDSELFNKDNLDY